MKTPIEWSSTDDEQNQSKRDPWKRPQSSYQDLILKPEYEALRMKFPIGQTWFRICPAMARSPHGWMLGVFALNFQGGRFAHPKTHKRNAKSVFDHAYRWFAENHPESLFSKTNKSGVRLLPDPVCVCYILTEVDGKPVPRLFVASGYKGDRGGVPGLGHQLLGAVHEKDESGAAVCDPIAPTEGRQILIEKRQPSGVKYPSYHLRVGRQQAPIDELIAKMDPDQRSLIVPLEQVVRELDEEEEWNCLARVIAPQTVALIRESLKR